MIRHFSRLRRGVVILFVASSSLATTGCATSPIPPPIVSKAPLGSVIIYRNGVAYFERHLPPGEKELTLRVPAERVDDFLKSLTILDDKTGETMPVSYPTLDPDDGEVEMTIELPPNHNGLKISYVTESPAWKPSYRLVLDDSGDASLQGWAVVDNVSGEDWTHVAVGVGSTSALSFRYDLHSVHLVERETLSSGSLVAVAPPTGGSPYAVKRKSETIVADLGQGDLNELSLADATATAQTEAEPVAANGRFGNRGVKGRGPRTTSRRPGRVRMGAGSAGVSGGTLGTGQSSPYAGGLGKGSGGGRFSGHHAKQPQQVNLPVSRAEQTARSLAQRIQHSGEKIRIEGFAKAGDKNPRAASLERANLVRKRLLANGVDPNQVDAIGNGVVDDDRGIQVFALESEEDQKNQQDAKPASAEPLAEESPRGRAHFVSSEPMTIAKDHSAMVSILSAKAKAERVYFYDPISDRGSDEFAFNAIRLTNPSEYTLDSGPFTVYAKGRFLGEGLTDAILPKATAFVPYALDRNIVVEPKVTGREAISRLVSIQRGIVSTESRQIRKTKLAITNRGQHQAVIYVRHKVARDHELITEGAPTLAPEKLDGAHLFRVTAEAGETVELAIEEFTPVERTVDLSSDHGVKAIAVYLKNAEIEGKLKAQLETIIRRHLTGADLQENIQTLAEQMAVYRTRVDELNVQLVTLRKLPQGARLRRHLSDKMEEISDKLQDATMESADLRAQLMTERIELQDAVAELTLRAPKNDGLDETGSELAKKD
jgi:hypothetical protein